MERSDLPAMLIGVALMTAAVLAVAPVAISRAGGHSTAPPGRHVPRATVAETVPRIVLSSEVVQIASRYGEGFASGRCNEPLHDFCSLAARLYHPLSAGSTRQVRIGTVAGTAAGGTFGRLGFIMNVPGWRLLRARGQLTVTLRGTVVHGEMLVGLIDRRIRLILVP